MEKVFTNVEHAKWLREQARLKRPYWYGTYYNPCTEKLLTRKAKQYPSHYTEKRMPTYRKHIAANQICGDCVNGAIKGAIWSELGTRSPVYKSHGCPDKSADGMFEYCQKIGMDWGTIDTMPDVIGLAVRMAGHVGVYVGNGEVVEWRGFAYGCVVTKLNDRKWKHWYQLPWTKYNGEIIVNEYGTLGSRLLKKGKKGADVKTLQQLLMKLGYALSDYGDDGDYGEETEEAVKAFQCASGLEVDGDYGPLTHAALMTELSEPDEDGDEDEPARFAVTVTGGSVYVREGASTAYNIITVVHKGDVLTGLATADNGWHCVEINGKTGWISGKYTVRK